MEEEEDDAVISPSRTIDASRNDQNNSGSQVVGDENCPDVLAAAAEVPSWMLRMYSNVNRLLVARDADKARFETCRPLAELGVRLLVVASAF